MTKIDIARAYARELIERDPGITAVLATGSVARGDDVPTSDVDLKVLLDVPLDDERPKETIRVRRGSTYIDAEYSTALTYTDPIPLLQDSYLAGAVREAMLIPLFVQVMHPRPGGLMAYVQQEIAWMIAHGLHREAFQALWAGFALGLDGHEQAPTLARAWLARIGWRDEVLETKARKLEELLRDLSTIV